MRYNDGFSFLFSAPETPLTGCFTSKSYTSEMSFCLDSNSSVFSTFYTKNLSRKLGKIMKIICIHLNLLVGHQTQVVIHFTILLRAQFRGSDLRGIQALISIFYYT